MKQVISLPSLPNLSCQRSEKTDLRSQQVRKPHRITHTIPRPPRRAPSSTMVTQRRNRQRSGIRQPSPMPPIIWAVHKQQPWEHAIQLHTHLLPHQRVF